MSLFQSVHDMLTPPGIVRKTKFWDFFDGDSLRSWWTFGNTSGTGSSGIIDGVDEGGFVTCGATNGNGSYLDFGNIRHYNFDGAVFEAVWRITSTTDINANFGLFNDISSTVLESLFFNFDSFGGETNFQFRTAQASGNAVDTGLTADTDFHRIKGDQRASSAVCTVDGTLVALSTAQLPTLKLQPTFFQATRGAAAKTMHFSRYEAFNT